MSDSTYSISARWLLSPQGNTLKNQHLIVENGIIQYLGKFDSSNIPTGAERIEYKKGLVVPGLVNAHTHIPETLIRGLKDDAILEEWLYDHVWQVEPKMNTEDAKIGTELGIAEMLRTGTVGFLDQFYFADQIAKAVYETGMKAFLAPSIFDGNAETKTVENSYHKNLEILKKWHKKDNRIFVGFGPHATYTVGEDLYLKIYEQAKHYDTYIHTHLNETTTEVKNAMKTFGMSPIEKMADIGVLDRIFAAHCIHLSEHDKQLLAQHKVTVLHNIQSNLKIGAGIAQIPELIERGINVTLGTDGSASNNNLDLLEEMRLSALLHKGLHNDPQLMKTNQVIDLATKNASAFFHSDGKKHYTGELAENNPADLVVIDLDKVNTTPVINPVSNWLFASSPENVALTMVNGKILYKDGQYTTLDIHSIKENAQKSTERMMDEANYLPVE